MFSWGVSFERQFGNHLNKGIPEIQSLLQHPGPLQVVLDRGCSGLSAHVSQVHTLKLTQQ